MTKKSLFSLMAAVSLALGNVALAGVKDYQVTGPVLDVNDSMIAVQKGSERWEIARDSGTKVSGEVKKGDKVTVHYKMKAEKIEAKGGADAGKGAKASPSVSPKK